MFDCLAVVVWSYLAIDITANTSQIHCCYCYIFQEESYVSVAKTSLYSLLVLFLSFELWSLSITVKTIFHYVSAKPYAYKSVHCILSLYIFLSWRMLVLLLGVPRYVACKAWRRVAFAQLWWRQSSQLLRGQNNLDPNLPIQISGQY